MPPVQQTETDRNWYKLGQCDNVTASDKELWLSLAAHSHFHAAQGTATAAQAGCARLAAHIRLQTQQGLLALKTKKSSTHWWFQGIQKLL